MSFLPGILNISGYEIIFLLFQSFSLLFLDQGQEVLKPKKVIVELRRSGIASDKQRENNEHELLGYRAIDSMSCLTLFLFW